MALLAFGGYFLPRHDNILVTFRDTPAERSFAATAW
jgi:hypothetical protein